MKASKSKRKQGCSAKMKSTSEVLKTELTKLKSRLKRLEWVEYELKIHVRTTGVTLFGNGIFEEVFN